MVLIIAVITFIVALVNNILCPINRGGRRVMRDPRDGLLSYLNPFALMSEADVTS